MLGCVLNSLDIHMNSLRRFDQKLAVISFLLSGFRTLNQLTLSFPRRHRSEQ